ncbi:TIGR02452 family protein (plasmid) [Aneurinibacillus sp. Ricciae_BoGa-3]|uniref:TIGR02452 family protein n=1 Tax=Aneurinibacillus sp. Ricciae_BoGa-3 TaxID=3022697 RepID=UPI002340DB61|nr:TIGR02452 family protein [Aneurinibacillus sp. Ricciae_BoGa-3]WCK57142.1 TIGR02452 family protein [Aneurinibacillus sp. Ricciae_BoGa-3]
MNKQQAIEIAESTLAILKKGEYQNQNGENVSIYKDLNDAILNSVLYRPEDTDTLLAQQKTKQTLYSDKTVFEVTSETTLQASKRLVEEGFQSVSCLNFASARTPGGGFLTGSLAQEETIARASGLYPCISQMDEMYSYNKRNRTALYSDYMIFSPNVPVIRQDNGMLLDKPFLVSVITSPAVNAGVVMNQEKESIKKIAPVMRKRMEKIVAVALAQKQEAIVLGAFGCGVFRNRTEDVARMFRCILEEESYLNQFKKVVFAIYERPPQKEMVTIFKRVFRNL